MKPERFMGLAVLAFFPLVAAFAIWANVAFIRWVASCS